MDFPFVIDTMASGFHVLRDDLIPGGSKRRALSRIIPTLDCSDLAYAGTVMGHGALAFVHAAKDAGRTAHIFIGAEKSHPLIQKLEKAGATIHLFPPEPISALHARAQVWQLENKTNRYCFPIGFDMPEFSAAMSDSLRTFDATPYAEIWTTCVSGTLTRSIQTAFPDKIIHTVKVVKADTALGNAFVYAAPEKYHQAAINPPPYPSCPYTDAKLWQFALKHAAKNALIWNTAG